MGRGADAAVEGAAAHLARDLQRALEALPCLLEAPQVAEGSREREREAADQPEPLADLLDETKPLAPRRIASAVWRSAYEHAGELKGADGRSLAIDGLWSIQFGKGAANNGAPNTLFFTAGPDDESYGLFGTITAQ